jgi:tRNA-modifying protein YgfZ
MNLQIYRAARDEAVWRDMSHFGRFRVSGQDAAALLHHLTTNDINRLRPGTGCDAALITNKARLLDLVMIYRAADYFLVLTSPNRRDLFKPHAEKFILFRQDIRIEDVTATTTQFGLFGPRSEDVLDELGLATIRAAPLHAPQTLNARGVGFQVARTARLPSAGVLVWGDAAAELAQLVRASGRLLADNETYNVLRVEAGLPVAGLELTEEINPWEAGLDGAISLSKGCYNGQEVVARLHTYKKVKQRLYGLKMQRAIPMGERAALQAGGRNAGFITSSVESPTYGPIALAYVRGDYQHSGQQVEVVHNDAAQTATVVKLPFANE